jgi:hypothetical protein
MSEPDTHQAWTVKTNFSALHGEDFAYTGPMPEPGDVIEVESGGGQIIVSVRVTRVNAETHKIDGAEIS